MRCMLRVCSVALLVLTCAGSPKRPEARPPRIKDSAPEKVAAQKNATPGLRLESEDERWGVEAAKERKRAQEQARAKPSAPAPAATQKGVHVTPGPAH